MGTWGDHVNIGEKVKDSGNFNPPVINALHQLIVEVASGSFNFSGLREGGKITHLNVSGAWAALPTTPLTNRNSMKIVNRSETDDLFLEFDNGVATGDGDPLPPGGSIIIDITPDVILYASTAGGTAKATIVEIA